MESNFKEIIEEFIKELSNVANMKHIIDVANSVPNLKVSEDGKVVEGDKAAFEAFTLKMEKEIGPIAHVIAAKIIFRRGLKK